MPSRRTVLHVVTVRAADPGGTAALIGLTSATRAAVIVPAGTSFDTTTLVDPVLVAGSPSVTQLRHICTRKRASVLHAHDAGGFAAVAAVADETGRPWVATAAGARDVDDALGLGADLVLVRDETLLRAGPLRLLPADEVGAVAADLEEHYRCLADTRTPGPQRTAPVGVPTVSVIVATFNRCALLTQTLRALEQQDYPPERFEVVVIDNGSTDNTHDLLSSYAGPLRLTHLARREPMLVPHARNDAAAASTGEVLAFTDDDCRPVRGWLTALAAGFRDGIGLVQGRTMPDPVQPLAPLSRSQWTMWEFGLYETCNIAYRRDALDLENGPVFREDMPDRLLELFGERFRFPFGEDVELAWRLRRAGIQTRYSSTAVVHHEVSPPDVGYHVRRARIGTGWPLLVRRNPELRRSFLTGRIWLGPHRPLFLLAAVGAVVGTRKPGLLALAAPWLWHQVQPTRPGRRARVRALPAQVLIESATTAALVRGSVGARSVVL